MESFLPFTGSHSISNSKPYNLNERIHMVAKSSWEAHHDHVKEKGLLAKRLYVVLTKPAGGMEEVRRIFKSTSSISWSWKPTARCSPQGLLLMTMSKNGRAKGWSSFERTLWTRPERSPKTTPCTRAELERSEFDLG